MSYCVQCGVRLASYEKVCPLCGTPVVNPNPEEKKDKPRFVDKIDISNININHHFITNVITTILIVPIIITAAIDLLLNHKLSWSLLVAGAEVVFWFFVLFPWKYSFKHTWIYGVVDTAVVALYVLLIALMTNGMNWYLKIALPLLFMSCVFIVIGIIVFNREKANRIWIFGSTLTNFAWYLMGINLIIHKATAGTYDITWALWPGIPLFTIGLFFVIVSKSSNISDWFRRKLFI
ncbi:MAG: hypothetical protein IJM15_08110 [Erysipelotrichaceae bacterium]|nr:hypothetical protein [Erysipelotrichaceae bacterium]